MSSTYYAGHLELQSLQSLLMPCWKDQRASVNVLTFSERSMVELLARLIVDVGFVSGKHAMSVKFIQGLILGGYARRVET